MSLNLTIKKKAAAVVLGPLLFCIFSTELTQKHKGCGLFKHRPGPPF